MKGVLKKEILDVKFYFENFNLLDKTSSSWARAGYKKIQCYKILFQEGQFLYLYVPYVQRLDVKASCVTRW